MVKYITGIYALNIFEGNDTCGDWHSNILQDLEYNETEDLVGLNFFKELKTDYCELTNVYVANHVRALADMFKAYVNTNKIKTLKYCVNDYLDGREDKKVELYNLVKNLNILDEDTKDVYMNEFGLKVMKLWT